MGKKNSIKLPPLPNSEPEGDMAEYLAIVQAQQANKQARDDLPSTNDSLNQPTHNTLISNTSPTQNDSTPIETGHSSLISSEVENNQAERDDSLPIQSQAVVNSVEGNDPRHVSLSKILDKKLIENSPNGGKRLANKSTDKLLASQVRPSSSQLSKEQSLEQYLQTLPIVFTSGVFGRGEVKIRVTEQMGYLLKLINQHDGGANRPMCVSENLMNELLRQFFVRFGAEIAQLLSEAQRQEADRQARRLIGVQDIITSS